MYRDSRLFVILAYAESSVFVILAYARIQALAPALSCKLPGAARQLVTFFALPRSYFSGWQTRG